MGTVPMVTNLRGGPQTLSCAVLLQAPGGFRLLKRNEDANPHLPPNISATKVQSHANHRLAID